MSATAPPREGPGSVGGPGLIRSHQEKASVVFRRLLRHPIEDVWEAVTDPAELASWFLAKVDREDSVGGRLVMEHPNGVRATGKVLEWTPPRVYAYEWNLVPGPNQPGGEASVVRWELSPAPEGTLLILTHERLTRPMAETFIRGLPVLLERLQSQLDGTPLPHPFWVPDSSGSRPAP